MLYCIGSSSFSPACAIRVATERAQLLVVSCCIKSSLKSSNEKNGRQIEAGRRVRETYKSENLCCPLQIFN